MYDLSEFESRKFHTREEIQDVAAANVEKAKMLIEAKEIGPNGEKNFDWFVGGILYNPPKREEQCNFSSSFFSVKNQQQAQN